MKTITIIKHTDLIDIFTLHRSPLTSPYGGRHVNSSKDGKFLAPDFTPDFFSVCLSVLCVCL
jgi:hypothetical protein